MKDIEFYIKANSSTGTILTVTQPDTNLNISQYDISKVVVQLDEATLYPSGVSGCSIIMRMLSGASSAPTSLSGYDDSLLCHLIPDPSGKGKFYFFPGEAIGHSMSFGSLNRIYFNFQIYRGSTLCSQAIGSDSFSLYRTNLSGHYQPDDLSKLYAGLNLIQEKI
jgi:hypothetical protein